ncbi:type II secretion system F family protein [Cryptosporangium aurantiacum]|uniref:type II secretion system F family protein n=1 Tax=Cryptosporangium aurantiacum TaxID=134849 RepID=UPI001C4A1319|nr:type II secretion system F family protein [Cryptosporangium aurantiacum]
MALLNAAGLPGVRPAQLLGAQVGAALVALGVTYTVVGSSSVGVCFAVFGFLAPSALVRRLRTTRARELRDAWPDVVDNLASAIRAGMSLPEAVGAIAERGPAPLRPAFARFAADYRATGNFLVCLDRLKSELSDPVADRICEALRVAREVGGTDLGHLLRALSGFLREDARIRAELEARQGWTVNAARLAVAAPWLVLLLLAMQSTSLRVFDTFSGRLLLALGGATTLVAYRLMLRIGRLPTERRVLT